MSEQAPSLTSQVAMLKHGICQNLTDFTNAVKHLVDPEVYYNSLSESTQRIVMAIHTLQKNPLPFGLTAVEYYWKDINPLNLDHIMLAEKKRQAAVADEEYEEAAYYRDLIVAYQLFKQSCDDELEGPENTLRKNAIEMVMAYKNSASNIKLSSSPAKKSSPSHGGHRSP